MRKIIVAAVCASLAALMCLGSTTRGGTLPVVHQIDFPEELRNGPEGLPRAFALAWDGESLNVSALLAAGEGTFGTGFLQINPSDGSVRRKFGTGGLPIRTGMTFDGTDFWTSTVTGFVDWWGVRVYSHMIEKWSATDGAKLESVGFFDSGLEPTGLAWDGSGLWLVDNLNRLISRLNSQDFTVVESHPAPGTELRGLTWDGSAFWTLDPAEDRVYRIDSAGNLLATYSAPASELSGITYDGEYLWVVDNNAEKLLQLAVPEPSISVLLGLGAASIGTGFAWRRWRRGWLSNVTPVLGR